MLGCRSCGSSRLQDVLSLGLQHLADFRPDPSASPLHPLALVFCLDCSLLQLRDSVPAHLIYHERYGFKSGVNSTIRADLEDVVSTGLGLRPGAESWLDIACNDGTLLSFVPPSLERVGIEPVGKLAREAREHANEVVEDYFPVPAHRGLQFDLISSISVFYDFPEPSRAVAEIARLLAPGGVWICQQNYLLSMLRDRAVDNICHEHLAYYSLRSFEHLLARHGLEVFDVSTSVINGGSFRTLVCQRGERRVERSVGKMRLLELAWGLDTIEPYARFEQEAHRLFGELGGFIRGLNEAGKSVYIYGASTRGGTLWQGADLDVDDLPFAVDRNPEKVGKWLSCIGTPIISEQEARERRPDYMLVSPWFFRREFVQREADYLRSGGRLIFPLPELEVVGDRDLGSDTRPSRKLAAAR